MTILTIVSTARHVMEYRPAIADIGAINEYRRHFDQMYMT